MLKETTHKDYNYYKYVYTKISDQLNIKVNIN